MDRMWDWVGLMDVSRYWYMQKLLQSAIGVEWVWNLGWLLYHVRGGIDNLTRFSVGELDGSCLLGEHDFRKCFFGSNSVT